MICSHHLEDLQGSGLTDAEIKDAGLYCADSEGVEKILGFKVGPALVFPYPSLNGNPPFSRVKPDTPPIYNGKPAKYLSPKNSVNRLYIPASLSMMARQNVKVPIVITEGEKKAIAAAKHEIICIGVAGVTAWKDRNGVIKDFDYLYLKNRRVFICFDSDASVNPNVKAAELALAKELRRKGAVVEAIRIPPGEDGKKQGLDDYLLTHSVESFWSLPIDPLSEVDEKRVLSLDEFMNQPFPPIVSLVGDGVVTAASLVSIVGRAKLGKTWFTTQLGLSIAGLSRFFIAEKLQIMQPGRVLYINAEVAEAIFQKRLGLILSEAKAKGLNTAEARKNFFPVTVRGNLRIDQKEGEVKLMKLIDKVKPNLIVLDPIGPLHYTDENRQQDVGKLLNFLLSIVNYFNSALILVHHAGKSVENREEIHFGRGSSVWGDRVDSNLNLMPYGEQGTAARLKLSFTLRNGPPMEPLVVSRKEGEFLFHAVGQTDDVVEWAEDILKSEGSMERDALLDAYKASGRTGEKSFKRALDVLERAGKMVREREGFPAKTTLVYLDHTKRSK